MPPRRLVALGVNTVAHVGDRAHPPSYQRKTAAGTTQLSLGVNNLLDRQPPVIYTGPAANAANSDPGTYDCMADFSMRGYARLSQAF